MKVNMLGWHWEHTPEFVKERPEGIHGMQIILVQSRARIGMGGSSYNVEKNTAFIVESCYPHALYAVGEPYVDDWIRFDLEDEDTEFFNDLGIEHNVPIQLETDTVSELIRICVGVYESENAEKDAILRYLLNAIFMQIKSCSNPDSRNSHSQYEMELEELRRQIYDDPSADWNLPEIAQQLNLSVSHFQRLYKQRYGIPCTKDILTSRMEYAKELLVTTDLPAVEIAEQCGYLDYSHFSKVFQKYACVSPSKYRKNNR